MTFQNILKHELIGLNVFIKKSTNPNLKGRTGLIINETFNTLTLNVKGKNIMISKSINYLTFTSSDGQKINLNGNLLVGRPEERIKIKRRIWA